MAVCTRHSFLHIYKVVTYVHSVLDDAADVLE